MNIKKTPTALNIITDGTQVVNKNYPKEINVIIHIPDNVNENIKRQKINRIYDILKPDILRK